jgi:hypothetical protein
MFFVLMALAFAPLAWAQQSPPLTANVEQQMSAEQFKAAGLDKLSPQELAQLEAWLATHPPVTLPASRAASARIAARVPETPAAAERGRDRVESRIAGRFHGWHPGSVLTLQNGQQWRVIDSSELVVRQALDQPPVTVRPGLLGGWNLKVEGYNTQARVKPAN